MSNTQYITPPPDLPVFIYKHYTERAVKQLISWAAKEHQDRLKYCAAHGYWKELKRLNENYSAIRVLAEIDNFTKICANLTQEGWNQLTMRERVFVRRAYEMKRLLG